MLAVYSFFLLFPPHCFGIKGKETGQESISFGGGFLHCFVFFSENKMDYFYIFLNSIFSLFFGGLRGGAGACFTAENRV